MTWKSLIAFDPFKNVPSGLQPTSNLGCSLRMMDFTDHHGLRGSKNLFTAPQDRRLRAFDIDLDYTWQRVLAPKRVQSDGFDFYRGFAADEIVVRDRSAIHTRLKTGSLKFHAPISEPSRFGNNSKGVEAISRRVLFDAPNVRWVRFENKYRALNT